MYHKWQSCEVWFLRYEAWRTHFFVIMKNRNVKTLKKTPGDIIILHKCTQNHDHMLYYSLDIVCNRFNYFSFWAIFCLFTSLEAWKLKIKKKKKMPGDNITLQLEISSPYNSVAKIMVICYTVPEIWCVTDVVIFHFGPFFALLPR